MKKIVFLCSGDGGNLKFIKKCIDLGFLEKHRLSHVIADRPCGALVYAEAALIDSSQIEYTKDNRTDLLKLLSEIEPDVIVTNIHKILDKDIVQKFDGKLINLHYSLLPAFKGMIGAAPVKMALELGCKFIGTTTHFVVEDVDAGKIISQSIIPVNGELSFKDTMNAVFRSGALNLLNTFQNLDEVRCSQSAVANICEEFFLSPRPKFFTHNFSEDFWSELS